MNDVKQHLKRGFETFSTGTSFHGFAELYTSKTSFWIVSWILILLASFGLTIYQVNNAIALYIAEPTNTVLLPAKEEDVIYPPLRICSMTWLFWVDWEKVISLNIKKSVVLYGVNYFNGMFSSEEINITQVEIRFHQMMVENNFSTIFHFYNAISRPVPIVNDPMLSSHFDEREVVFKDTGYLYCYTMSKTQMKIYFSQLSSYSNSAKTISFTLPDESFKAVSDHITKQEYTQQMIRWIQVKSMYVLPATFSDEQLLDFAPPIVLFPNGYDIQTVDIHDENDFYNIHFDATVRTLKNNERNVCLEGKETYNSDDTCQRGCYAKYRKAACSCYALDLAVAINETDTTKICHKGGFNYSSLAGEIKSVYFGNLSLGKEDCWDSENLISEMEKCNAKCINPCTIWTYDFTTSVTKMSAIVRNIGTKSFTRVTIQYPIGSDIIVMTEVNSQTFDSFVANVGGLLGIWTGASMVSFIQFFYLCCCADSQQKPCFPFWKFNNLNVPRKIHDVIIH